LHDLPWHGYCKVDVKAINFVVTVVLAIKNNNMSYKNPKKRRRQNAIK
jgi:hypothetical protein